jgi:hypothetical protein
VSVQYDYVDIQAGDRIKATIGCGANANTCAATVVMLILDNQDEVVWIEPEFEESSDGKTIKIDEVLDDAAGANRSLIVEVYSKPNAGDDGIYFANGRIVRP